MRISSIITCQWWTRSCQFGSSTINPATRSPIGAQEGNLEPIPLDSPSFETFDNRRSKKFHGPGHCWGWDKGIHGVGRKRVGGVGTTGRGKCAGWWCLASSWSACCSHGDHTRERPGDDRRGERTYCETDRSWGVIGRPNTSVSHKIWPIFYLKSQSM
jgi:hypothetical protein